MRKNIPHILEQVMHAPWLITPGGYKSVLVLIDSKLNEVYADEFNDDFEGPTIHWAVDSNGIATIPIKGVLGQRLSGIEKMCGGTDYLDLQQATQEAIDKKYAKGILYAFDSSGGMVRGCADLAAFIQELPVPTAAFTDSRCNSAAYWLASACNEITSSSSADVGSIGVILPWIDKSKVWEVEGLKYDPFVNEGADLKGAGAGPSLTDAQKQHLQESVNFVGEKFQNFVSSNRKVKPEVFRAGTYFGEQALDVGLVDQVGPFSMAYQNLLTRVKNKNGDRAPVPTKIQVTKMTKEELKAQHPELYQALVQENETTAQNALEAARVQERNRLAELDALSFTPECKAIVDAAKAGNQTAPQIGVQIAQLLAKDNEHLRMQVGVYRGAKSTSAVANVDPNSAEDPQSEKALAGRLTAHFQKKFGSTNGRN